MGGLHSGRKRRHTCIDDCLTLDTTYLKKRKLLQPGTSQFFTLTWRMWHETNFSKRTEQEYTVGACLAFTDEQPQLTLTYQAGHKGKGLQNHTHTLALESTPCQYGGQRWWFRAPCCGNRIRVLYINPRQGDMDDVTPQCRHCQGLHYRSQLASYQERHATYERYLLSNFGYWWAEDEYRCLKEHYFKVTPEWAHKAEHLKMKSHLQMLKLLIRTERLIARSRITTLKKLSLEGRREFFEELAADPKQAEELAEYRHLAHILIHQGIIPPDEENQAATISPEEVQGLQLSRWIAQHEWAEQELKEFEALAA